MTMCWEINEDCVCKWMHPSEAPCPAFREGKGCWEIDWIGIISSLSSEKKEYWKKFMNKCPNCPVYALHKDKKDQTLEKIASL
jgi:hypothetical protein